MVRLELNDVPLGAATNSKSPVMFWRNFWLEHGRWTEGGKPVQKSLAEWGGELVWDGTPMDSSVTGIEFQDDWMATAFLLRWS